MKKNVIICVALFVCLFANGQVPNSISNLFYGLPLGSSKPSLFKALNATPAFKHIQGTDTIQNWFGIITNLTGIKNIPDSSTIHVTLAKRLPSWPPIANDTMQHNLIITIYYYFSSEKKTKNEYDKVIKTIHLPDIECWKINGGGSPSNNYSRKGGSYTLNSANSTDFSVSTEAFKSIGEYVLIVEYSYDLP